MVATAVKEGESKSKFYYITQELSHDQNILFISLFIPYSRSIIAL